MKNVQDQEPFPAAVWERAPVWFVTVLAEWDAAAVTAVDWFIKSMKPWKTTTSLCMMNINRFLLRTCLRQKSERCRYLSKTTGTGFFWVFQALCLHFFAFKQAGNYKKEKNFAGNVRSLANN